MKNNYLISYDHILDPIILSDFEIHQIGRIICNENTYYKNHYHNCFYELTVVTEGEGIVYTNNKPVNVKKGDIYFSCLHDIHAIKSSKENPLQYAFCAFFPTNEKLATELENLSAILHPEQTRLFRSNRISTLLPFAIDEMQNLDSDYSKDMLNCIFFQIVVYLSRKLQNNDRLTYETVPSKTILCYQIMDYINSNIDKIFSLTELSDVFHLSYSYLSTVFKKTTSMTLVDFYNMQRLTIAEKYILENVLTLEQIAQKLNFATPYSLSKAFKKKFKFSPRHYRAKNLKQ